MNTVLVKAHITDSEPRDIAVESSVVKAFRDAERIQRVYAPDQEDIARLQKIMEEIQ